MKKRSAEHMYRVLLGILALGLLAAGVAALGSLLKQRRALKESGGANGPPGPEVHASS